MVKSTSTKDCGTQTDNEYGTHEDNDVVPSKPGISKWKIAAGALVGGTVLGVGAVVATPLLLASAGFTAAGITSGSLGAGMMSAAAAANGGGVAAGSLVAVLQSAGAGGAALTTVMTGAGATGAVAGAAVGAGAGAVAHVSGKKEEEEVEEVKIEDGPSPGQRNVQTQMKIEN